MDFAEKIGKIYIKMSQRKEGRSCTTKFIEFRKNENCIYEPDWGTCGMFSAWPFTVWKQRFDELVTSKAEQQ